MLDTEKKKSRYPSRSAEELKTLVKDIIGNLVFTDRHMDDHAPMTMIFAVLMFMDQEDIDRLAEEPPGMIYEYYDKASPRAVNGYPMFFSCRMLNQEDAAKVWEYVRNIQGALDEL